MDIFALPIRLVNIEYIVKLVCVIAVLEELTKSSEMVFVLIHMNI